MAATTPDIHSLLGLAHFATAEQVNKAYKKAALNAHPDRHNGNTEAMAIVSLCWSLTSVGKFTNLP
jgi:hypothetical protein